MTTYYNAKHALGAGKILELSTENTPDNDGFIKIEHGYYYVGRDIYLSKVDASAHANKIRLKKIASLKKQIAKLEAMKF